MPCTVNYWRWPASLLETLNALICEEGLLTAEQRQPMVMTVATLGALGERVRLAAEELEARKVAKKARSEKKPREPDPVFPRSGTPWTDDDDSLLDTLIEDVPDEEIDHHMHWLSGKLGRTPYAIALRIVSRGRRDDEWPKTFRPMALTIREEFAAAAEAGARQANVPTATSSVQNGCVSGDMNGNQ